MAGSSKVKESDLSRTLVKDGRRVKAVRLGGYVGKKENGLVRFYASQQFTDYLDINEKDILDTMDVPKEMFGGGTYIWVSKDADVIRGREEENTSIRFLEGEIREEFSRAVDVGKHRHLTLPPGECTFWSCWFYTCDFFTFDFPICWWWTAKDDCLGTCRGPYTFPTASGVPVCSSP